ncbi:MAG: tRNA epoxyqueuosine(34) reductase QueG [Sedimentisphaerales bacterium]|nr:tRNA epoxyqueuosine(34) reductase QueG [Sedimentisphaerales bacterium]
MDSQQIKYWGLECGFDLVGIAPAEVVGDEGAFRRYLERGYHGDMVYLGRNVDKRLDPGKLVAGARSIICVGINYYQEDPLDPGPGCRGRVARYAWGRDYHEVLRERLKRLADKIIQASLEDVSLRCFVDTAPLMEKAHAARAGLGWIGKNGLLLNKKFGSWMVLGEIITDMEFEYDEPVSDGCGDCRKCLEACPTRALVQERVLDARRCISYLTIESKLPVPAELESLRADWLFGCDVCQDVCPYNQNVIPARLAEFKPHPDWWRIDLGEILALDEECFHRYFKGSSLGRTDYGHFMEMAQSTLKRLKNGSL